MTQRDRGAGIGRLFNLVSHPRGGSFRAIVVRGPIRRTSKWVAQSSLNACEPQFCPSIRWPSRRATSKFKTEESGTVELPCTSLPDLLEIPRDRAMLNLLHCDAQGAEIDILEAVRSWPLRVGLDVS